jgi:hypothetical protein
VPLPPPLGLLLFDAPPGNALTSVTVPGTNIAALFNRSTSSRMEKPNAGTLLTFVTRSR